MMFNDLPHVKNKKLFTTSQGNLKYTNIINDNLREEYYLHLSSNNKNVEWYDVHFVWNQSNGFLDMEGILIRIEKYL